MSDNPLHFGGSGRLPWNISEIDQSGKTLANHHIVEWPPLARRAISQQVQLYKCEFPR